MHISIVFYIFDHRVRMARGQQKIQSQQKNAKRLNDKKKQDGHDQKAAAQKALTHVCTVCKAQMPDPKTHKQHFENKHPKLPLPDDLKDA
ncbi:Zinc finger protein 706 [Araneus ventricosus]|uniref:Zinc finger protein 706 n=1 Tax=Araneus ventricosus TaxID=182803 RepID=A0A4Y2GSF6_ARAVE|nr:Zinc finger protein 706 [Araneus ventricosus]